MGIAKMSLPTRTTVTAPFVMTLVFKAIITLSYFLYFVSKKWLLFELYVTNIDPILIF
jgi:hypothetical protein